MTEAEREAMMVEAYGEVCTRTTAGKILSRSRSCINGMLADGRLSEACGGTMVDVRSIARYICAPRQQDFEARRRKTMAKYGTEWAV